MRVVLCFLHIGVFWMVIGLGEIIVYENEPWTSCLDPDGVECEVGGNHAEYNRETGKCEVQDGTDCEGGENYFQDIETCNMFCKDAPKPPCSLELDTGRGRAYLERWFFNTSSAKCEKFIYGGGGGNANRFRLEKGCNKTCHGFQLYRRVPQD
uniref:BPTI/Kunitz inhibitor domain-containing protein n=1 Tax=Ixodes ricinus TaxID=34613 RepID=V5ICD2_IXORI